jgi:hypothetical protein
MKPPLGSLHRYWLKEIDKRGMRGLMVGDYSNTSHSVVIQGLINMGYCKVKKDLGGGIIIVEVTSSGKYRLKSLD